MRHPKLWCCGRSGNVILDLHGGNALWVRVGFNGLGLHEQFVQVAFARLAKQLIV